MMKKLFAALALALTATAGHASVMGVSGFHYQSNTTVGNLAFARTIIDNDPVTATFDVSAFDFGQVNAASPLSAFLGANGTITNGADTSVASSVFLFTGQIMLEAGINEFDVFSDDGFELVIDGTVAGSFSNNRAPALSEFDFDAGAGGVFDFELVFWDGPGGVTVLNVELNDEVLAVVDPIPLPAGMPLLLAGACVFGVMRMRRRKA